MFARSFRWNSEEAVIRALERANDFFQRKMPRDILQHEIAWSIAYSYGNFIESELFGDELLSVEADHGACEEPPSDPDGGIHGFLGSGEKARIHHYIGNLLNHRFDDWIRHLVIYSSDRAFARTRVAYARNLLRWLGVADVSPESFAVHVPSAADLSVFFANIVAVSAARVAGLDQFDVDVTIGLGQPARSAVETIREILDMQATQCVLLLGPPGSGRTPLARRLVAELGDAYTVIPVLDMEREWNGSLPGSEPLGNVLEKHLNCANRETRWFAQSIFPHAAKPVVVVFDGFDECSAVHDRARLAQLMHSFYRLCEVGARIVIFAREDILCEYRLIRAYLGQLEKDAQWRYRHSGHRSSGHLVLRVQPMSEMAQRAHARSALRDETEVNGFMKWLEDLNLADTRMFPTVLRAAVQVFNQQSTQPSIRHATSSASIIDIVARIRLTEDEYDRVSAHLERASLVPLDEGLVLLRNVPERALLQQLSIVTIHESDDDPCAFRLTFVHEVYKEHFFVRLVRREIHEGQVRTGEALQRLVRTPPRRALSLFMRHFAEKVIIDRIVEYLGDIGEAWPDRLEAIMWHILLTTAMTLGMDNGAVLERVAAIAHARLTVCCIAIRSDALVRRCRPATGDRSPPAVFESAVFVGRELAVLLGLAGDRAAPTPSTRYLATLTPEATSVLIDAVVAYDGRPEKSIGRILEHLADQDRCRAFLETDAFILEQLICDRRWLKPAALAELRSAGSLARLQDLVAALDDPSGHRLERVILYLATDLCPLSTAPETSAHPSSQSRADSEPIDLLSWYPEVPSRIPSRMK